MTHTKHGLRLDLRSLILVLCALTALVMLCASYFASYRVQRQLLIDHALEANRVYAAKLASITETFIASALRQLAFSAGVQANQLADADALQAETDRVLHQGMAFNSTFVVDAQGILRAALGDASRAAELADVLKPELIDQPLHLLGLGVG